MARGDFGRFMGRLLPKLDMACGLGLVAFGGAVALTGVFGAGRSELRVVVGGLFVLCGLVVLGHCASSAELRGLGDRLEALSEAQGGTSAKVADLWRASAFREPMFSLGERVVLDGLGGDGPEFTVVSSDLDMVVRCVGPDGQVVEFLESRLERSAW